MVAKYLGHTLFTVNARELRLQDNFVAIITERLNMLYELQYGVKASIFHMSDQQVIEYVLKADYIPRNVLSSIHSMFDCTVERRGRVTYTRHNSIDNPIPKYFTFATEAEVNQIVAQLKIILAPMLGYTGALKMRRNILPKSDTELGELLQAEHLTYGSYARCLTPLECDELRHYISAAAIKQFSFDTRSELDELLGVEDYEPHEGNYSCLPKTRQELSQLGGIKYTLKRWRQLEKLAIMQRLQIQLPANYKSFQDEAALDKALFDVWLSTTKVLLMKARQEKIIRL